MRLATLVLVGSAVCLSFLAVDARCGDIATVARSGDHGVSAVSVYAPTQEDGSGPGVATRGGFVDGTILWHRHHVDPIYTSTGASAPAAMAVAGTYLNPPKQLEATPFAGDGTPDWMFAGNEFFVDASREGTVLAAVDFSPGDSTATISEWAPGSSTPLWSYVVHPCRTLTYQGWASRKPIRVSDDGSTIAAAIVMYTPEGQRGRLFVFDAGNGTPAVDFPFPDGNVVATEISANGDYIAMAGWPTVYVFDRAAQAVRWSGPIGSGNDALAISGDGRYLAWGWTTFHLREWTGSSYTPVWTPPAGAGRYVGQCALANDNSALAVSWDNGNTLPNQASLDLYDLPSLDLAWSYDFQTASATQGTDTGAGNVDAGNVDGGHVDGGHVDILSHLVFTPDGEQLAMSSWGDDFPELHVFDRAGPEPLFTLDTPGSMFDAEIVEAGDGTLYVTTCGKGVHAGTGGRGGDQYAIEIVPPSTGVSAGAGALEVFALEPNYPNPFNPRTNIVYSLSRPGPVHLGVYDLAGRLVRRLAGGGASPGRHTVAWDGSDGAGMQVSSGMYLVRLESGGDVGQRKILLVK